MQHCSYSASVWKDKHNRRFSLLFDKKKKIPPKKPFSLHLYLIYFTCGMHFLSRLNWLTFFLFLLFWYSNTFNNCWYFNSWLEKTCSGQVQRRLAYILLPRSEHKNNIMHCYQQADTSELPPSTWFGAWAGAAHISSYTVYDTAWMDPLPEFCLLLIGREDISIRRSSVCFDFHVYHPSHIHHNPSYE